MSLSINKMIDRGAAQLLSSGDKDFIDNLSGVVNGKGSINSIKNMMEHLSNPGNVPQEFEGDWLIDYFKTRVDKFNLGPFTDILGLDTSMLSQFDQALGFAQYSVGKMSGIGFGVGDFVTKISDQTNEMMSKFGSTALSSIRDMGIVKDLFSFSGITENEGDPLKYEMNALLHELAEDSGYILSRKRARMAAANFHFVTRPYLESDTMGRYRSYVFFTRPNCNLVILNKDGKYYPHPQLYKYKELSALVESDPELFAELCRDNCNKSNLFTLLNNYCKEIPPLKLNETDRTGIQNKFGFAMPVSGVSNNNGLDISVTFMDNANGDISKLLYCMDLYKREVSKGGLAKRSEYIKNNMIDTAMSAYMVVVDTNYTIIAFAPCIGLHISDPPTHFARHSLDGFTKEEILGDFTVNFKCFDYSPHDPSYYDAFNRISGFDPSRVVDVRGSTRTLYKMPHSNEARGSIDTDKSVTSANMPHRRSVFDREFFGYSGGRDLTTGKIEEAKSTFLNPKKSLGELAINTAKDFAASVGFFKDNSKAASNNFRTSVNFGYYMPYPDTFEFMSKFPGVHAHLESESSPLEYIVTNTGNKTPNGRVIKYKLGFSR